MAATFVRVSLMQLVYKSRPSEQGNEGQKSDSSPSNVLSRINSDSSVIEFGRLVTFLEKNSCALVKSKEDIEKRSLGVSISDWREGGYKTGATLSVLRQGRIFVALDNEVKSGGEPVFVNPATGTFGSKREGAIQLKGACFMSAGQPSEIIEMEINLLGGAQ
jgi:hypothetical protein